MEEVLKVNNLNIEIGGRRIITNLSFELKKGDILTILGPNGVGKSMLIKSLLGLIRSTGEIKWVKSVRFGYLPQGLTALSLRDIPLTVKEFFSLKTNSSEKKVKNMFKRMRADYFLISKRKVGSLSGGQFQKLLFVWALLNNPTVLLLDEPTSGIDPASQEKIYATLHKLSKEKKVTVVLVTHDLNVIYRYSTKVLCLSHRFYCSLGKPEEINTKLLKKVYEKPVRFYNHSIRKV